MSGPESFFEEKLAEMDGFLVDPDRSVMRLIIDPEMKRMPLRYLECKDADDNFAHLLFNHTAPFDNHLHWNQALLALLDGEIRDNAEDLEEVGADTAYRKEDADLKDKPWRLFLYRAERLAISLRDGIDSLVFVLDPEEITEPENWPFNIRFFADQVSTPAVKFIVLEDRAEPLLEDIEEHPKVYNQLFWLSPEEIEKRAESQLETPVSVGAAGAPAEPVERRRALSTVGIMANARKDHARAEEVQKQHIDEAREAGESTEMAMALYNLGNTYLDDERPEEAVEVLLQAADGCCYHELDELMPMVYTNLGIALHRADEQDSAFQMLKIARDCFRNQRNVPGEAYVCDTLALLHHNANNRVEAEKVWHYALKLYDGITNPAMSDVVELGKADIESKLDHFGYNSDG